MTKTKAMPANKVVTGEVRFSYAHVWEPDSINGSDPKYSVSILIPKSDTKTIDMIQKAIEAAKEMGKSEKFGGKIPANLKLPLRDGDEDRPDERCIRGIILLTRRVRQNRVSWTKIVSPLQTAQRSTAAAMVTPRSPFIRLTPTAIAVLPAALTIS